MAYKQVHPLCSESGCPSQRYVKGLCKAHWRRLTGELQGPVKHYNRNHGASCRLVCDRPAHSLGLCKRHYRRYHAGLENWYAPLMDRSENGSIYMGHIKVRARFAAFFQETSEARGLTLRQLAKLILEEYAQERITAVEDRKMLTRDTRKRR